MTTQQYFVRIHGKVLGPFAAEQLCTLRDRGQFRQFHEVSEDRRTWRSAASLWVFRGDSAPPGPAEGISRAPGLAPPPQLWYYADENGIQQGPLPASQLIALRTAGKIGVAALVWREGLSGWLPFHAPEVGLARPDAPPPAHSTRNVAGVAQPHRRKLLLAGAGVAAALVVVLAGVAALGLRHRTPAVAADDRQRQAGAALMASETNVWTLEGQALKEAQELLAGAEARAQFTGDGKNGPAGEREKRLREFVRVRRSGATTAGARNFVDSLNGPSRRFLSETAARQQLRPEDLVLEWLTYEGALDYGMMMRIWREQGNFKGEAAAVARSFLEGSMEAPAAAKGVRVVSQTDNKIVVNLFGATVIEEVLTDKPARADGDRLVVCWKSNYGYLREILRGKAPKPLVEETLTWEDGRYRIDYKDWFEEYLGGGHRQLWATELFEDSALAVASAAENEKIRDKLGKKPSEEPRSRQSLRELFARLSPAVPLIEALGSGTGSGFLVRHDGKLLVLTNRHVVENARGGIAVHFITANGRGQEHRHLVPSQKAAVVAIHRKADLAVIDVSRAADDIRAWGIEPVALAPKDHVTPVGEHVFAIGHPGDGGSSGQLLTRTLSDGIVSANGRSYPNGTFLQVTVPINPGNSGGPLFDDDGRVVGVNTFGFRKNAERDLALEALNFSLEVSFVHELLSDQSASLSASEIAQIVAPRQASPPQAESVLAGKFKERHAAVLAKGFRPYGGADKYYSVFAIRPGEVKTLTINVTRGQSYVASVVSEGATDVDLAAVTGDGAVVAADTQPDAEPLISFRATSTGRLALVIAHESGSAAVVTLCVYTR